MKPNYADLEGGTPVRRYARESVQAKAKVKMRIQLCGLRYAFLGFTRM
jgi:hypothetical protein